MYMVSKILPWLYQPHGSIIPMAQPFPCSPNYIALAER
jgi:hypothetical protein